MRRLLLWVALAVVSVRPLAAETFLYATAASQQRIDGFRVLGDNSLSRAPARQQRTGADFPRRLIARGCSLYVAESDRVEVFRIAANGDLQLCGATRHSDKMRARDIDLSPDGQTLYVPFRRLNAIAAYPLDAKGMPSRVTDSNGNVVTEHDVPAGEPASCVYSPTGADWEDIEVTNGKVYGTYSGSIEVYGIVDGLHCSNNLAKTCTKDDDCVEAVQCVSNNNTDGKLRCSNDFTRLCEVETIDTDCDRRGICAPGHVVGSARVSKDIDQDGTVEDGETTCTDADHSITPAPSTAPCVDRPNDFPENRPQESCFFSNRTRFDGIGLKVDGTTLVASTRFSHRLQGFRLEPDGNLPLIYSGPADSEPPTDDKAAHKAWRKQRKKDRRLERKCRRRNQTAEFIRYIGLTLLQPSNSDPLVFATGTSGRTDAFRLQLDDTRKPNDPGCDAFEPASSPRLSREPNSHTPRNVISTPTRSAVGTRMLYVAGGELDRIQAFRLFEAGGIDPNQGPIETDELKGSFPNDVVLVDTSTCPADVSRCD